MYLENIYTISIWCFYMLDKIASTLNFYMRNAPLPSFKFIIRFINARLNYFLGGMQAAKAPLPFVLGLQLDKESIFIL